MAKSRIEWTDRSDWNPVRGCTRKSLGCANCYAEVMAARFSQPGMWGHGFAHMMGGDHRWTGKVELITSRLTLPMNWKTPALIFPSSTSDIFHESLTDEEIDFIFGVMALCPQHTFQPLTKREDRMREYFAYEYRFAMIEGAAQSIWHERTGEDPSMWLAVHELPNVWLGVSIEDRPNMLARAEALRATKASACVPITWWSAEPLIGDLGVIPLELMPDWVVCGGESGHGARDNGFEANARSLLRQCKAAGVPFFGKQNFKKAELPEDLQIREMPL